MNLCCILSDNELMSSFERQPLSLKLVLRQASHALEVSFLVRVPGAELFVEAWDAYKLSVLLVLEMALYQVVA